MQKDEFYRILKQGEDSQNQFKERIESSDALVAEICAFANTKGGRILI